MGLLSLPDAKRLLLEREQDLQVAAEIGVLRLLLLAMGQCGLDKAPHHDVFSRRSIAAG